MRSKLNLGLTSWSLSGSNERLAEVRWNHYAAIGEEEAFHEMRVEHARLLDGMPEPEIWPYESVYRGGAAGRRALIMTDDVAAQVRGAYRVAGVVVQNPSEPVERVAAELEFMGLLAKMGSASPGPFFNEHANAWMPDFAEELLSKSADCGLMRLAASALSLLIACIGTRLGD